MPNRNEEHHRVSRFCTCCIASTYSGSLLRKRIHVVRRKDERCDNFCEMDAKNYDKQTRALCTREWKSAAHSPPYVCSCKLSWQNVDFSSRNLARQRCSTSSSRPRTPYLRCTAPLHPGIGRKHSVKCDDVARYEVAGPCRSRSGIGFAHTFLT